MTKKYGHINIEEGNMHMTNLWSFVFVRDSFPKLFIAFLKGQLKFHIKSIAHNILI